MRARLAITPGEPAGIGPELIVKLAQHGRDEAWIVIGDPDLLSRHAARLGLPLEIHLDAQEPSCEAGRLTVLPVRLPVLEKPGTPDVRNAPYVLETLERAAAGCMAGEFEAVVTGPVQKSIINEAGIPFTGHTEFFAEKAGVQDVVMLLVADSLRVALATTHLPLAAVPAALTQALLERRLRLLLTGLSDWFGIGTPRVLVAGLNPHAGEGGHLGDEERRVIEPVCERLRREGAEVLGPLPADTLFTPSWLDRADAVMAMYHDQGLPVLKYAGFGRAVNVTVGLPFLRTSVDHGTALDIAGEGRADTGSLKAAIELAGRLASAGARRVESTP